MISKEKFWSFSDRKYSQSCATRIKDIISLLRSSVAGSRHGPFPFESSANPSCRLAPRFTAIHLTNKNGYLISMALHLGLSNLWPNDMKYMSTPRFSSYDVTLCF